MRGEFERIRIVLCPRKDGAWVVQEAYPPPAGHLERIRNTDFADNQMRTANENPQVDDITDRSPPSMASDDHQAQNSHRGEKLDTMNDKEHESHPKQHMVEFIPEDLKTAVKTNIGEQSSIARYLPWN